MSTIEQHEIYKAQRLEDYRAWRQGDTAALEGVPAGENPHRFGSEAHRYWELGRQGWPFPSMRWTR